MVALLSLLTKCNVSTFNSSLSQYCYYIYELNSCEQLKITFRATLSKDFTHVGAVYLLYKYVGYLHGRQLKLGQHGTNTYSFN